MERKQEGSRMRNGGVSDERQAVCPDENKGLIMRQLCEVKVKS